MGLQKVEVQVDAGAFVLATGTNQWTADVDTTDLDNGDHMFMAKATDLAGNQRSAMVSIKVKNLSSLSLVPSGQDVTVGDVFSLAIRMDTKVKINAAQVVVSFPANLQVISMDNNGSGFAILANTDLQPGKASISVGNIKPVTGDKLVANVVFKAVAAGTVDILILNDGSSAGSMLLRADNSKNALTSVSGGSYNLVDVADTTPPSIAIVSPLDGDEISGIVTVSGTADDK